jgi:hypothetical protein
MLPIFHIKNPNSGCLISNYHGFKDKPIRNSIMKFIDTPFGSMVMVVLIISIIFVLANL